MVSTYEPEIITSASAAAIMVESGILSPSAMSSRFFSVTLRSPRSTEPMYVL